MMRDFVLQWTAGLFHVQNVKVILPNIKGQKYAIGSSYPGERKGEEFLFLRHEEELPHGVLISVDAEGQYWIQNDTRDVERRTTRSMGSFYNTFVNGERLNAVEIRRLKSGDVFSLGSPKIRKLTGPGITSGHPVFFVKERNIPGDDLETDNDENETSSVSFMYFADSPLANNLILEKIMSYLHVRDLKSARLVCKKWGEEGTRALERRGKVYFSFREAAYLNPDNWTRVFRYLHEMGNMKIQNVHINLDPRPRDRYYCWDWLNDSEGQKGMDDLRTLLTSSHAFSSLFLEATIKEEEDVLPFLLIFQELGGKLKELTLNGDLQFFPEVFPPFPPLTNLKKFAHHGYGYDLADDVQRWVSLLVPLFSNNLETFTCRQDLATPYFTAFLAQPTFPPNLKGIAIEDRSVSEETLSLLLLLKNPLKSLSLAFYPESEEEVRMLERLLSKHSPSLRTLVLQIDQGYYAPNEEREVKFPSFPKLEDLELTYENGARVSWDTDLDYGKHFPSLRKLKVGPELLWREDDPVFNAFFPDNEGEVRGRCETVTDLRVPVIPLPKDTRGDEDRLIDSFQPRMDRIGEIFPNAVNKDFFIDDYWFD